MLKSMEAQVVFSPDDKEEGPEHWIDPMGQQLFAQLVLTARFLFL